MPFARPTLPELVTRVRADFKSRLGLTGELLRRAMAKVLGDVWAGTTHMLHGNIEHAVRQLFATTADREFLIIIGAFYGLSPKAATFAAGTVLVTGVATTPIPIGSVLVRDDAITYTTDGAEVIGGGGTVSVAVTCEIAGSIGNLDTGELLSFETPITDVDSDVTVEAPGLAGGIDEEDTELFRARLLLFIQEPPMGGTDTDYVIWTLETPGVAATRVFVYRHESGLGTVTVRFMVDDPVTGAPVVPSGGEVALVQAFIDGERPITAEVTVAAPVLAPVAFTISITPDNASTQAAVEAELDDLFFRGEPGDGAGRGTVLLSQMQVAIGIAQGVDDFTLTVPAADVVPALGDLPTKGVVTFV